MKIRIATVFLLLTAVICNAQIVLKDILPTQKNTALTIRDNYYAGVTIQQNRLIIQPTMSFFTTRLQEEYWLLKGAYNLNLGEHVLLAPGIYLGGNLGPDFNYIYAGVQALFTFNRFYINLEPMYGNVEDAAFKLNTSLEYEAIFDKLFLSAGYRPNRFLANEQNYWQFGLALKENRMSIQPAFLIPENFNVEKLQFMLNVNYWIK